MDNFKRILTIVFVVTILFACKNPAKRSNEAGAKGETHVIVHTDSLPFTDTIVVLNNFSSSSSDVSIRLDQGRAKTELYKYFKAKGFCVQEELKGISDTQGEIPTCVQFDTIYPFNLNKDQYQDAIITYWLAPAYASGTCFQPHFAMLISRGKVYTVINEDFIADNYRIDSLANNDHKLIIYAKDYDCSNHKFIRRMKVTLN